MTVRTTSYERGVAQLGMRLGAHLLTRLIAITDFLTFATTQKARESDKILLAWGHGRKQ